MAGDIFLKEGTIATVTSTGGSTTDKSATSAGTIDLRNAGTTGIVQNMRAIFSLQCQWATVTGIVAGTEVAQLYLVPAIDGTNYPDVDTTGGASVIGPNYYVGSFTANKAPSANTNMLFESQMIDVEPLLYTVYILNKSGQTISTNWTLKVMSSRAQYT